MGSAVAVIDAKESAYDQEDDFEDLSEEQEDDDFSEVDYFRSDSDEQEDEEEEEETATTPAAAATITPVAAAAATTTAIPAVITPPSSVRGRKKGQVSKFKKTKDKNSGKIRRIKKRLPADYIQKAVDRQMEKQFKNTNDPFAIACGKMLKAALDDEIPIAIDKAQVLKEVKPVKASRRSIANPFIIYQKRNIARIKLQHTASRQMKDYSRQLSEEWRRMTVEERKPYVDEYRAAREVHEKTLLLDAEKEARAAATVATMLLAAH